MATADPSTQKRSLPTDVQTTHPNGHDLVAIAEWIPGKPPTDASIDLVDGHEYETRYWRCRKCGQERNRPREFGEPCAVEALPNPITDGGYTIEDGRTRRALTEDMRVHFGERGPRYVVDSESGSTYHVDVESETCTCPDHERRAIRCKHLRRVDLEVRAGLVPGPDGTFVR